MKHLNQGDYLAIRIITEHLETKGIKDPPLLVVLKYALQETMIQLKADALSATEPNKVDTNGTIH